MPRLSHSRQCFIIPGFAPEGAAMEVTGFVQGWSIDYSDGYGQARQSRLSCTIADATMREVKQPTFTLWGRTWQWLKDCPLRRTPHETGYPLL